MQGWCNKYKSPAHGLNFQSKQIRTVTGITSQTFHLPVVLTGLPPLRATLLTLKLWLDRSIIVVPMRSMPGKLPLLAFRLSVLSLRFPHKKASWRTRPRLGMETESIHLLYTAPPLSCGLSFSRCKKAVFVCLSACKNSFLRMGFCRMTNSPPMGSVERGTRSPCGLYFYAAKAIIAVISFVSSLRFNPSSTYRWVLPYSSYSFRIEIDVIYPS